MWTIETGIEIAKLLGTLVGAVWVVWYWNIRRDRFERHRFLDECYHDLLEIYFAHPSYGDEVKTTDYSSSFQGDEGLRYHFFAMRVHTVMESLYDLSEGHIPDEWAAIFRYHTKLHASWLKSHKHLHEPAYAALALTHAS